jgi:hypothetical protein
VAPGTPLPAVIGLRNGILASGSVRIELVMFQKVGTNPLEKMPPLVHGPANH